MSPLRDFPFAARPMIVAHRGDTSLGAVENSIEAASAALISGADMIEVDVQWTADEVFVCWHDERHPALEAPIHQSLWADVEAAGVTSLIELLELGRGRTYFNLEVKEYSARDPKPFMHQLVELCHRAQVSDHALISSFRPDYIREAGWTIPTCIIHPDRDMYGLFTMRAYEDPIILERPLESYLPSELMKLSHATGYGCQISELTPAAVAEIRSRNILLGVYTITTEEEFDQAVERGARVLVCETPQVFAALRNKRFPIHAE